MKGKLIPFNGWSKDRIARGMKTCTSRHTRYTDDPRVTYISPALPKWFIVKYFWKEEGAKSPEELIEVFSNIYGRVVGVNEKFYIHFGDFRE